MTDKKKYDSIISDMFGTFIKDMSKQLENDKSSEGLDKKAEATEEDERDKDKDGEDPLLSGAMGMLDKIIEDVMSKASTEEVLDKLKSKLDKPNKDEK